MSKAELVSRMAEDAGIRRSQAQAVLKSVLENLEKALQNGERVTLTGFGTFATFRRSSRSGRNPQTGKTIRIPEKKIVKFSPGLFLKQTVQGSVPNAFTEALLKISRHY